VIHITKVFAEKIEASIDASKNISITNTNKESLFSCPRRIKNQGFFLWEIFYS